MKKIVTPIIIILMLFFCFISEASALINYDFYFLNTNFSIMRGDDVIVKAAVQNLPISTEAIDVFTNFGAASAYASIDGQPVPFNLVGNTFVSDAFGLSFTFGAGEYGFDYGSEWGINVIPPGGPLYDRFLEPGEVNEFSYLHFFLEPDFAYNHIHWDTTFSAGIDFYPNEITNVPFVTRAFDVNVIPELSSLIFLSLGLLGAGIFKREILPNF